MRIGQLRVDCIGEPVTSVSLSHDGNCLLASSLDNSVRLFDKATGEMLSEYKGHTNKVCLGVRGGGGGGGGEEAGLKESVVSR